MFGVVCVCVCVLHVKFITLHSPIAWRVFLLENTHTHTHTHTYIHTYKHTYLQTHLHTHTYKQTYNYTHADALDRMSLSKVMRRQGLPSPLLITNWELASVLAARAVTTSSTHHAARMSGHGAACT